MNGTTRDYTGRQTDLEFLQTVVNPAGTIEMSITATSGTSRRVAGVQKAVQRYVSLLLTPSASVPFPSASGNTLLAELSAGRVSDMGYLRHLFNMASSAAIDAMKKEDYNTTLYGDQAADERIAKVELSGMTIDYPTSTLGLSLTFRTEAGEDYAYVVPVSTRQD